MRREKTDFLFGHIALHLVDGYSAGARRVGAALLEHYNKKTGQCDPSIMRLATMLDLSRSKVLSATAELCAGDCPLFRKLSHGGLSRRASYLPCWDQFNAIVDDWDARMKDGAPPSKVQKTGPMIPPAMPTKVQKTGPHTSRKRDLDGPENWTRTDRSNRQKKTGVVERPAQGFMIHALPGGKKEVARAAAERRLDRDIRRQPTDVAAAITDATDAAHWEAAAEAEERKHGSGLKTLIGLLRKA